MQLGLCGSIDTAAAAKAAGFDFLEVGVQPVLRGDVTDAAWTAEAPDADRLPLPIEAANSLLPGTLPVVGPARDVAALQTYMQRVAERAARLGIRRLVFGSGKARRRPEDVSPADADAQLDEFCRLAGDACAAHDVLLVIEHLNRSETNTLNRLTQVAALLDRIDHPGVTALVDSYHYGVEGDPADSLARLAPRIRHVHVAEPVGRGEPGNTATTDGQAPFDFVSFFRLLRQAGYDERVSIEAKLTGPLEAVGPRTAAFLRTAWQQAEIAPVAK